MNENLYDLLEKLLLNTINEQEKKDLDTYILDKSKKKEINSILEELKIYYKIPFTLELENLSPHVKSSLLKSIKLEQQIFLAKQMSLRYRNLFYSACAMLLVGIVYVSLFTTNQKMQNDLNNFNKDFIVVKEELNQVNKDLVLSNHIIKNSLCNSIHEFKMNTSITNKKNYGKVYVNNSTKKITFHICHLEKISDSECFQLWAIDKEGNSKPVTLMYYDHEFKEENYIIELDLSNFNETEFVLTIENSSSATKPSNTAVMKSIQI